MSEAEILYTKTGKVAKIILNRPAKLNALNQTLMQKLGEAFMDAEQDPEVGSILLTGAGDAFSSGGDLEMLERLNKCSAAEVYQIMRRDFEVVLKIYTIPKPLITVVNGMALGGGCSLALLGDVILASDRAQFGMIFSRLNLGPDMGASFLLPRLVGLIRAKDLFYSGRVISAEEAFSYGMVSEVCPHENLMAKAMKKAQELALGTTQVIGIAKDLLNRSTGGYEMASALDLEAKVQAILLNSQKTREAIQAFLKKHKPESYNQ
jgi:2-(1,2-epoxy-1,2-dihydrophenyl)acetyl-CoA isomerase